MPKRTNDFQTLIAFIEKELAPLGARVTESAEIAEAEDCSKREVDVLIEAEINGHPINIAIECRDHKTPQDVTWIDQLIGKYRDLAIPNVVAVSKSGFTDSAIKKAERLGIRTLTLKEAQETDWSQEKFIKPYIKFLSSRRDLKSATIEYKTNCQPQFGKEVLRYCQIVDNNGNVAGSVEQVILNLYKSDAETDAYIFVKEYIEAHFTVLFRDKKNTQIEVKVTYDVSDRFVSTPEGRVYEIDKIIYTIAVDLSWIIANHEYYFYNCTQITVGSLDVNGGKETISITTVQFPEKLDNKFKTPLVRITQKKA